MAILILFQWIFFLGLGVLSFFGVRGIVNEDISIMTLIGVSAMGQLLWIMMGSGRGKSKPHEMISEEILYASHGAVVKATYDAEGIYQKSEDTVGWIFVIKELTPDKKKLREHYTMMFQVGDILMKSYLDHKFIHETGKKIEANEPLLLMRLDKGDHKVAFFMPTGETDIFLDSVKMGIEERKPLIPYNAPEYPKTSMPSDLYNDNGVWKTKEENTNDSTKN